MSEAHRWELAERPAIYINAAADVDAQATQWVMVGAEEEGVPCLDVSERLAISGANAAALAYAAAQSSHIGVGVGIAQGKIALHETHMPALKPVLSYDLGDQYRTIACLVGSNAGRFVKHMPLRFPEEPLPSSAQPEQSPVQSAVLARFFEPGQEWNSSMLSQIVNQVIHTAKTIS